MLSTLQQSADFLSLTRQYPDHIDSFAFETASCQVEVWQTGIIVFTPKSLNNATHSYVFSSAVHGNETAPIEICNDIISQLLTDNLTIASPVMFIFGNPPAINIGERFVEENLNRLFSGNHSKGQDSQGRATNAERERAKYLEQCVSQFFARFPNSEKTHYDLHTAIRDSAHEKFAVYPFLHGKPWSKVQFEILRAMGVTTFLLMPKPASTFSYYSSNTHDAAAFTIELGKVRPFGENDQASFAAAKQTLIALLKGKSFNAEDFNSDNFLMMKVHREIIKHHPTFTLNFAGTTANFTEFKQGDILAFDGDLAVCAECDGEAIVFPNAGVEIGQRALLTVIKTDISDNLA